MYIQQIPFLITVTRNIRLTTIEVLEDRKETSILNGLMNIKSIYENRGFRVGTLLMDREFIPFEDELRKMGIKPNASSASEHVPEVERQTRVVKERVRGLYHALPYQVNPKVMITNLVSYVVGWLNNFPVKGGVSKTLSPRALITGVQLDHNKHCKLEFGEYVQVHEENNPTNSMQPRATGAIALGSTYNLQTGYKFMSLNTGRVLHRCAFTPIPLTQDVVTRVEDLGRREGRPTKITFQDRNGLYDEQDNLSDEEEEEEEDELDEVEPMDDEPIQVDEDLAHEGAGNNDEQDLGLDQEEEEEQGDVEEEPVMTRSGRVVRKPTTFIPSFEGNRYEETAHINLHVAETLEYDHSFLQVFTKVIDHYMFREYGLKKGLQVFGEHGKDAAIKEMEQLHLHNCFKHIK